MHLEHESTLAAPLGRGPRGAAENAGWKRTFWAVWVANCATTLGLQSFLPFFPTQLEQLGVVGYGLIAVWTGAIFGAAPLTAALMGPVWGALGDRGSRKAMVLRSMFATALFVGLMGFARTPFELLLLRIGQGAFAGVIAPSVTLVSIGAPRASQGAIAGRLQTALAAGAIVGPLLGAYAHSMAPLRSLYFGVAGLALGAGLLVAFFAVEQRAQPQLERRRSARGWTSALGLLLRAKREADAAWSNDQLRAAMVLAFWIQFAISATAPQMELYVRELVVGDAALVHAFTGALFTAMALSSLLATAPWGQLGDRVGHRRALVACALVSALALLAHALAPTVIALLAARIALGAASAGSVPCAYGVAAQETSTDRRGAAMGIVFSARALAIAIAALAGGWLSPVVGLRGLFALSAFVLCAAALAARRAPTGVGAEERSAALGLPALGRDAARGRAA
jgi:DHA1 family multidrug resistance protein-like MFS transporter